MIINAGCANNRGAHPEGIRYPAKAGTRKALKEHDGGFLHGNLRSQPLFINHIDFC